MTKGVLHRTCNTPFFSWEPGSRFLPSSSDQRQVTSDKAAGGSGGLSIEMEKLDNPHLPTLYLICSIHGRVAERFKAPVLKTGDPARDRGFESHPFRHITEGLS